MLKRIHFIGFGLIAASLASAIRKVRPGIILSAQSLDDGADFGVSEKLIDLKDEAQNLTNPDETLLIVAVPMNAYESIFENLSLHHYSGWITDVGSVKNVPAQMAKKFNLNYFGGHPMAGSEKNTAKNYNPILFENAIFVITSKPKNTIADDYVSLLQELGTLTLELTNEEHDQIAATISHLPQLLAVSLVDFTRSFNEQQNAYLQLAAGGFRDMTRIASSPAGIWKDILQTNHKNIVGRLDGYIQYLNHLKNDLEKHNTDDVLDRFKKAKITRDSIPRNTKGFLHALSDLYVYVQDEPGVIYKLSKILFENGINIRDIELLKVREGHQGAFRVAFSTDAQMQKAKELMESIGFKTQIVH